MTSSNIRWLTAWLTGLSLLASGAFAQVRTHGQYHPDVVIDGPVRDPFGRTDLADSAPADRLERISITPDNQILVELALANTTAPNLFDLSGRTLVFTPDGHGGYSRSVRSVAWDHDIGVEVLDRAEIQLQSFTFDFAGRRWGSFHVSRHGLLTFGAPLAYNYGDADNRFDTMREIAGKFVDAPTISPLFKPTFGGSWVGTDDPLATQHVAKRNDRVVVTWFAADTQDGHYPGSIRPSAADNRYQVVLRADGRIEFNYESIAVRDGIVGLFPLDDVVRGDLIASVTDEENPELPGQLDLLEAALYESNTDAVILEFTLRDGVPEPPAGELYSYRLYFDVDEPYWTHPIDWSDEDLVWLVDVQDGARTARGRGVVGLLPGGADNRIALLAGLDDGSGIAAAVFADAAHFRNDSFVQGDTSGMSLVELNTDRGSTVDLSRSDSRFSSRQREVFHYRSPPDTVQVACRVIEALGDRFDLFLFHNEFRIDSQEAGTPWRNYGDEATGTGGGHWPAACSQRLRGHYYRPEWLPGFNEEYLDNRLAGLAHEFTHTWAAYLSYDRNGRTETLADTNCACHWRVGLHTPAAFPWRGGDAGSNMSDWGGGFWREHGDGTFTPVANRYTEGGPSWLDLYVMGLASASEVPDFFLLRNLTPLDGQRWTGDKEVISIEQVVAAEGPREPPASSSPRAFNAGFVYLLEPGRTPDPTMLRLHAHYREKAIEYWAHVTGGRSRMTSAVPGAGNRAPMAVGTLSDRVVPVDGTAVVEVRGAFRDPDGDRLTYDATSSTPAVASVAVSGSTVTLRAAAVGTATVTVTATDVGGSNTPATLAFRVTVREPTAFTDDPIVPGVTPVRAVHFTELRERIDLLRSAAGLEAFSWTDPALTAGGTVRLAHLLDLRAALAAAYAASGRPAPTYTDPAPVPGTTPISAAHLMELRAAVSALQ